MIKHEKALLKLICDYLDEQNLEADVERIVISAVSSCLLGGLASLIEDEEERREYIRYHSVVINQRALMTQEVREKKDQDL